MCADAAGAMAATPVRSKPLTPGAALDEALAEKDREKERIQRRVDALEAEVQRLRRERGW